MLFKTFILLPFCIISEPIPGAEPFQLAHGSCEERKAAIDGFMSKQLGHHHIHDENDVPCHYDETDWCSDFCGYRNIIQGNSHFRLTNMNLNAYRDDPNCCGISSQAEPEPENEPEPNNEPESEP